MNKIDKSLNLSICIPAYNYGQYLPFTINSCLNNDYDFELVIVDNCSNDNTALLKAKYIKDKRVKWYTNDTVLPMVQNWNHTVSLSKRKYVKLLLADDFLEPNFFSLFDEVTQKYPNQAIYGHLTRIVDKDNKVLRSNVKYSNINKYVLVKGTSYTQMKLQSIARFKETSCHFFLKEKWEDVGLFNENFSFAFDVIFNSSIASKYGGCLISEYGVNLRRHNESGNLSLKADLSVKELNILVKKLYENLGEDIRIIDFLHGKSMVQYRIIELFFQRFKKNPFSSVLFFVRHLSYFSSIKSYPYTFKTIVRKIKTKDVQQCVENFI